MKKEEVLIEALPYIQKYEGKTFVIKYGGAAMTDPLLRETFGKDVTILRKIGINIVIVHGGGKEITEIAKRLGIETKFVNGQRYTDEAMVEVVQMVLAGKINKEIVNLINCNDGDAIGLSGVDNMLLRAEKIVDGGIDLGLVGRVTSVNVPFIELLLKNGMMPVIAPLGVGKEGTIYNINADLAAGTIADALKAEKLVYLSDIEGIVINNQRISSMTENEAERLIEQGAIFGGMIPKVRSAFKTLNAGVKKVHIVDGRIKHSLLLEIFTDEGIGTQMVRESISKKEQQSNVNKAKRHFAIKEIILSKAIPSQEDLCVDLKKRGFDITQATLSRDLKELGVDRIHSEDGMRYVLSTEGEERKMKSLIGFEVTSIDANEAMIVIRTLPGRAPGVASFLDSLHHPHLLGTVAGDDTVVVLPSTIKKIHATLQDVKDALVERAGQH